jgi:hypothetical protein
MKALEKHHKNALKDTARAPWTRYLIQDFGNFGTMELLALLMSLLPIDNTRMDT